MILKFHLAIVYFDTSSSLISFILLGKYFETLAKGKTSEAIQKLMAIQVQTDLYYLFIYLLQPNTAILVVTDENGNYIEDKEIEIDLVQRGDILKVLPGSRIPTDGLVVEGGGAVDESIITGESLPVSKKPGDQVIGGTINQTSVIQFIEYLKLSIRGLIRIKATKVGNETGLSQIIKLVQDAQTDKAPIQVLVL